MVIDARASTVFIDADDYCYEMDRAILLKALAKELGMSEACLTCRHSLVTATAA